MHAWLILVLLAAMVRPGLAQNEEFLAGTELLEGNADRSASMVAGIARWLERETTEAASARDRVWGEAVSSENWSSFAEKHRQQLRSLIGAIDPRKSGPLELIQLPGDKPAGDGTAYAVQRVRWPVFEGLEAEGLLFRPAAPARALVIALPDADQLPEQFEPAVRLAAQQCAVLVPVLVDRSDQWSGSEALPRFTNQPHREWIHRQAFELGRTLIGYEVQKVLAAIDALKMPTMNLGLADAPLGVLGHGEGGLIALHCAALDPRVMATVVSGYFGPREQLYQEPIYRNLFGFLPRFGDAQLAALIAPRPLIVEQSPVREITGPPPPRDRRNGAAPGIIRTPDIGRVEAEIERINRLREGLSGASRVTLIQSDAPISAEATTALLGQLGAQAQKPTQENLVPAIAPPESFAVERQRRTVRDLERFTQGLVREAERKRQTTIWPKVKTGVEWEAAQRDLRTRLWEEVIGKLPAASIAPNPRTRLIRENPKWVGYEVVLDVAPEVFAWGWLLVPRDLHPGERRPVVVCQHGLEGVPEDALNDDPKTSAFGYYKAFAARLAEQGFVVYVPHNPYRGGDKFRVLQRRANPLGLSLFSFIIAQHDVATNWLASLPFVDPQRIAFYGLSYGGKTAMRVPALLDRYCLSICSGDFNEWVFKNVSVDTALSYMFTGEYEMPEWNLANVANYAEMAMLIAPRPFMVERGHDDTVAVDEWVAYEYAKVRRGYTKLGLPDRTEIEWFDGPHTIHAVGTFDFLRRHLRWPKR